MPAQEGLVAAHRVLPHATAAGIKLEQAVHEAELGAVGELLEGLFEVRRDHGAR